MFPSSSQRRSIKAITSPWLQLPDIRPTKVLIVKDKFPDGLIFSPVAVGPTWQDLQSRNQTHYCISHDTVSEAPFSNCSYAFHVAKGEIFSLFLTYVVIGSSVAAVRVQSHPSDMDNDDRHCRNTGMACGAAMVPVSEVVESGRVREGGVWLVLAHCRLLSQTLMTSLILGLISH
jgi:hypothetical protein